MILKSVTVQHLTFVQHFLSDPTLTSSQDDAFPIPQKDLVVTVSHGKHLM